MNDTSWLQTTITYPGHAGPARELHAVSHLRRVLPEAENAGLISAWWFMRKGPWRVRYLPTPDREAATVRELLTQEFPGVADIYEPEVHAFGGTAAMDAAHTLFHHDSRHLLDYLQGHPADRQERSLLLCTTLMRSAGLDLNEQGDVWARAAQHRAHAFNPPPTDDQHWQAFTSDVRHLLLGTPTDRGEWHSAFAKTGTALRHLRETGQLTRGLRAIVKEHITFHWNRIGLPADRQARLANAAAGAIFGV